MKRQDLNWLLGTLLGILSLGSSVGLPSSVEAKIPCPEAPKQASKDVTVETRGKAKAFARLGEAELRTKVQVEAKSLLDKVPNSDRVIVAQMLTSIFCQAISESTQLSDKEKLDRITRFNEQIGMLMNPSSGKKSQSKKAEPAPSSRITQSDSARSPSESSGNLVIPPGSHIEQKSEGPNSPNVLGNKNQVTINPPVNPNAAVVTYDFGGAKRFTAPGRNAVNPNTPQVAAFKTIVSLYERQDWASLRDLCEQETQKAPEWLTPVLFAGFAYANLGDVDKAIERLEYVQKNAGGNPDYAEAERNLALIRQRHGR